MLKVTWNRDDYPGLIIGIRRICISDYTGLCPKCGRLTQRVIDIYGKLYYDCISCKFSWKYNDIIEFVNQPKKLRRQQMAINIKVKEYRKLDVVRAEEEIKVEVLKIEALRRNQLPERYIKQYYNVYKDTYMAGRFSIRTVDGLFTHDSEANDEIIVLQVGKMYPLEEFQKRIRFVRRSGRKLRKVNATIAISMKEKVAKDKITTKQKMFRI